MAYLFHFSTTHVEKKLHKTFQHHHLYNFGIWGRMYPGKMKIMETPIELILVDKISV